MNNYYNNLPINLENRSLNKKNNKITFKNLKKKTCKSLNEVEYFLNNLECCNKYIKLIKLLK